MPAHIVFGMPQSLDGYVADADGHISLPPPEGEFHRHFNDLQRRSAVSLYGRRMYETMRYWGTDDPAHAPIEQEFAQLWQETPKVVVSTTLREVEGNARLISGDVEHALRRLKDETEGEIDVGGPTLAATLSRLGLIDEYRLYFMPVVLGGGKPFFAGGVKPQLRYLGSERLPQGVVMARYAPGE
jgi:dihydrofolate reductase